MDENLNKNLTDDECMEKEGEEGGMGAAGASASSETGAPDKGSKRKRIWMKSANDSSSDSGGKSRTRRGRGRPPTTGQYVGMAKTQKEYVEARRKELELQAEEEVEDLTLQASQRRQERLSRINQGVGEQVTADLVVQQVQDDIAVIMKVASRSKNLKGTFTKSLKEAAASIQQSVSTLSTRTMSQETQQLQTDNRRLRTEVAELKKEVAELRATIEMMRLERTNVQESSARREGTGPQGSQPEVREIVREVVKEVSAQFTSRLEALERRFPSTERMRPPLAPDSVRSSTASLNRMPTSQVAGRGRSVQRRGAGTARQGSQASRKVSTKVTAVAAPVPMQPKPLEEGWNVVVGRKAIRRTGQVLSGPQVAARKPRLRPPKSVAVVVTLDAEAERRGETYEGILAKARREIDLDQIGIDRQKFRFRSTRTGARIIEMAGATTAEKADLLAERLQNTLAGSARVARPVKMAELRIAGLDDSIHKADVQEAILKKGGCSAESV
ncbi:unnamed protein product, partial [Diatraea saccharalis]